MVSRKEIDGVVCNMERGVGLESSIIKQCCARHIEAPEVS